MITKIEYIHKGKPLDVYNTGIQDPVILPTAMVSVNFFQDVYVPSVEGEITFSDVALYNLLPLEFGDLIRIHTLNFKYDSVKKTFNTDKEYYVEFNIISANMISTEPNVQDKDNYKQFVLNIIDSNSYKSYLIYSSKMYNNHSMKEIVTDVLAETWKPSSTLNIDTSISPSKLELTLPIWSVYHKLSYLSKFTEFSGGSGCVFFASLPLYFADGKSEYKFNYTNISSLMKNKETFIDEEYSLTGDINRVHNVFLEKDSNPFELLRNGTIINNVKIDSFPRTKLNKFKMYSDSWAFDSKYKQTRPKNPVDSKLKYEENYLQKALVDQIMVYCTVAGDFKRKVGTVIDLKFPSGFEAYNKRDHFEAMHSGKYLIRSIEHLFVKDKDNQWIYNQRLGLITDGYNEDQFKIYERQ